MADLTPDKIKNIILLSHTGAGKTFFTDMLAYKIGAVTRVGKTEEGTSISDYTEDEKERGISINSSIFSFTKDDFMINLIDTPGYLEFIGEVAGGLKVADSAILLVDASSGIEIGTEKMWSLLEEIQLPRAIFINKLDKENINFLNIIDAIKKNFGKKCVLLQIPDGLGTGYKSSKSLFGEDLNTNIDLDVSSLKQVLMEAIAESDDSLLEEYLDKGTLDKEKLASGIKLAIANNMIVPVFCGSAGNEEYVSDFINSIIDIFPSSLDAKAVQAQEKFQEEDELIEIKADTGSFFLAQVFKTQIDPYIGQLSVFRVFSGKMDSNAQVHNISKGTTEKLGQLYILQGKEQKAINSVVAGSIAAVAKLKDTAMSDTLGDGSKKVLLSKIEFPEPALSASIVPESREDEKKISEALKKLTQEDQTFKVSRDQQTKELLISGMGSLHLEIMVNKLKERFNVGVKMGTPKVPYKETITGTIEIQGKHKKQSGGRGQYGDVWLRLIPLAKGKGFEFEDKITGGAIPKQYIPAVEKGIRNSMQGGVIAGYPLVDFKAVLYDGSFHNVDSSDMAFQIAASMALKEGVKKAKPVLLEPIMDVNIAVPDEFMGQINKDLNSRRGRIIGMEAKGANQSVNTQVPLSEMLKYASELKSMTGGRGVFTMKASHYEQVPSNLSEKIIAQKTNKDKDKEKEN